MAEIIADGSPKEADRHMKGDRGKSGGVTDFQLQNPTLKAKLTTGVIEFNKETNASLDLQSIGVKVGNQGEYFTEKINEIDQELRKFDLEKDTLYGEVVTAEALKSSGCRSNEVTPKVENVQPTLKSHNLLSEHAHHVLYPNKNTKLAESHVPLTQTNPTSDTIIGITILAPTWKRISWEK